MAIPTKIKQLANDVRVKIYGIDVRESIAKGMEESGAISDESNERSKDTAGRQNHIEARYDVAVASHTEASEILDARVSIENLQEHENLKKRLDFDYQANLKRIQQIGLSPEDFGAIGDGVADDTQAFKETIEAIKTNEYTEAIPAKGSKYKFYIPAGKYKISESIMVPSYIAVEGAGKHSTILESYITDGSPIFNISQDNQVKKQQFYNTVKGLSINGRNQACQGIKLNNVSRWVFQDVVIDDTLHEGIYAYESYVGEAISTLVRACGDKDHFSVVFDGRDSNYGGHATSWFGGEINGGGDSVNGIHVKYGNSVRFIGATVQGFRDGIGILNGNGLATVIEDCYFEENKGHIESEDTYSFNIKGNMFGKPTTGALGHIIVENMYSGLIEGNFFSGDGFDHVAAKNSESKLHHSKIGFNYVSQFPIRVSQVLKDSGRLTGTIIESYSGDSSTLIEGVTRYKDTMRTLSKLQAYGGITDLSGNPGANILSGQGNPEGAVNATRGLYIDINGSSGKTLYIKISGTNSAYGWLPVQENLVTSSENRPNAESVYPGFTLFDGTLGKPIWWNGSGWVDAMGTRV